MKTLTKEIKRVTGLGIYEFCERELCTDYKAFQIRLKKNRLYPAEILYILDRLQQPAVKLFGANFEDLMVDSAPCPMNKVVKRIFKDPQRRQRAYQLLGIQRTADVPDDGIEDYIVRRR